MPGGLRQRRRWLLHARRPEHAVLAVRVPCLSPDLADPADLPLKPLAPSAEISAEHLEVVLAATLPQPEVESSSRQLVDDCRLLGDQHLVPRWQLQDRRGEPVPLGCCRDACERRQWIPGVVDQALPA